jgi:hypothetical protein
VAKSGSAAAEKGFFNSIGELPTFADTRTNGYVAPIPAVRGAAIEPLKSTDIVEKLRDWVRHANFELSFRIGARVL